MPIHILHELSSFIFSAVCYTLLFTEGEVYTECSDSLFALPFPIFYYIMDLRVNGVRQNQNIKYLTLPLH